MKQITLVVAHDNNNGIGKDNKLPWHLPSDLKHFKETTLGKVVLMGSNTYESLPEKFRPLPGRTTIRFSRNVKGGFLAVNQNTHVHNSRDLVDFLTSYKAGENLHYFINRDEIFVVGGASIYEQALPYADKIIATQVHAEFDCDAFFPALSSEDWVIVDRKTNPEENGLKSSILTYERVNRSL